LSARTPACATRKTARRSPTFRWPPARWCPRSAPRAAPRRGLAEACNAYLEKGSQVYVKGELRGEASDGAQNPRIWVGNDGEARASYEITARTVKFLGRRDNGNGAPVEPPPGSEDDDVLPF